MKLGSPERAASTHVQERPPQILQVYRDCLKPGSVAAYGKIEEDAARVCAEMKCSHAYLTIESLTGPKEVWFFNGYDSPAEQKQVGDDLLRMTQRIGICEGQDDSSELKLRPPKICPVGRDPVRRPSTVLRTCGYNDKGRAGRSDPSTRLRARWRRYNGLSDGSAQRKRRPEPFDTERTAGRP